MTRRVRPVPIPALMPTGAAGQQFVFCGDCCSGVPGTDHERAFAAVNAVLRRLTPQPEFVCFAGDHIMGMAEDQAALRSQWRHWLDHEMAWARRRRLPVYHVTSNHNTSGPTSEAVWREVFPRLPGNGPPAERGLAYFVRRGPLLLVAVNTASAQRGHGRVEHEWLDQVLTTHADAAIKLVTGHYPAHPVNGYTRYPLWRIPPEDAEPFWAVLVRHGVLAYLCSHIIAFDAQVHGGVLQLTSGGAGTSYGPGGFMPGPAEYHHLVQMAVAPGNLQYQVLDVEGVARECLAWPPPEPGAAWQAVPPNEAPIPAEAFGPPLPAAGRAAVCFRISAHGAWQRTRGEQTLLAAGRHDEGPPALWIGLAGSPRVLTVRLVPEAGRGPVEWRGPELATARFGLELMLHPDLGPGGVLWRPHADAPWSSLTSAAAVGPAGWARATHWAAGRDLSDPDARLFGGAGLAVARQALPLPAAPPPRRAV